MIDLFTLPRLKRYRLTQNEDDAILLQRYLWNIRLSEALYPALALFEVIFRNRVDQAISRVYGEDWLDEAWLHWPQKSTYPKKQIQEKRAKLKSTAVRGHLVAELNMGFWTSLLEKPYKPIIWDKPGVFETAFPGFKGKILDRPQHVFKRLERIRILRNRISHHEPIFDMPNGLDCSYKDLVEMICWLSEDGETLLRSLCRFESVWNERMQYFPNKESL